MSDLAQGYSANVVLNAGDTVRVSTVGQATVTGVYGAPTNTTTINASSQVFGPYQVPAKLRVTAVSGTANYAQPTQVPVTVDQSSGAVNPPGAVSGAGNRFSGTRSAPISTFNGASSSGVVGTPVQLKISAGSIVYGQSLTELSFVLRKVGTSTGTIDVRFGTTNSTSDTVVTPSTGNGFTATDPQEFEFRILLSYSAGKIYGRWTRYLATGGFVTDGTETTVAFDPAVDNYLSIVLSGFSAGTTVALLAARFQHFQ